MREQLRRIEFQENPSNERQSGVEKIPCSSSEVPFFIARSQRKLQRLLVLHGEGGVLIFKKMP